jgi:hypothetical protein
MDTSVLGEWAGVLYFCIEKLNQRTIEPENNTKRRLFENLGLSLETCAGGDPDPIWIQRTI